MTPEEALPELMANYRDQARYLYRADRYYRAEPNSVSMGSRIPPALQRFRTAAPYVRITTQAYADRVAIEDVSFGDDEDTSDAYSEYLDDLKQAVAEATVEALAVGVGYLRTVIKSDKDVCYQAVRGQDGAFLEDPDTGEILAVMRIHRPPRRRGPIAAPQTVTVYTPGLAVQFDSVVGNWVRSETSTLPAGTMLMLPLLNRPRAGEPYGRAEGHDLYGIQDQASRNLTNLSIASDALAVPQRVLIALEAESLADLSQMQSYMDSILALSGDVKVDQWQAAQLAPFIETSNGLGRMASATSGLPMSYFGLASEAVAVSGDAIRENDNRLEIRATQICNQFTNTVTAVVKTSISLLKLSPKTVVVKWSDPATPTPTAAADAAVKAVSMGSIAGENLVDREYIWNVLRMPPADRERIKAQDGKAQLEQLLNQRTSVRETSNPDPAEGNSAVAPSTSTDAPQRGNPAASANAG